MAHAPGPCHDQYEDWEDAYNDWQKADAAADKAIKNVGVYSGGALVVCGATWWTGVGLIGCAVGAGYALNTDYDSIKASEARDDARDDLEKAQKAYKDCVNNHKEYYK